MESHNLEKDSKKQDNNTKQNLFSINEDAKNTKSRDLLDNLSMSKEDSEADPIAENSNINNTVGGTNNSKTNGYFIEGGISSKDSKVTEQEINKMNLDGDSRDNQSRTERRDNAQHGESATPYDNGNLDSPSSTTNLKKKSADKNSVNESKAGSSQISHGGSKDSLQWNEENKGKNGTEEEKHDEERSLLDPENNIYGKDPNKSGLEDENMRRSSTKPEGARDSKTGDKNSKGSKDEEEEPEKEMSECQKKSIAFIDSWQWGIFMTVVTIYTLFFDDIRVISIPKAADDAFYTITVI